MIRLDPFSSRVRPALTGRLGAVSAAHPLAVAAGQRMLGDGGSAADALIAAQAVLAVVAPDACGIGGDAFVLLSGPDGTLAINGSGPAPREATGAAADGGASVAVPGLVDLWTTLSAEAGRLSLGACLAPAIRLAREGWRVSNALVSARDAQGHRLRAGGAAAWPLMQVAEGDVLRQPELAALLERIGAEGRHALHEGPPAEAVAQAVRGQGGAMSAADLAPPVAETLAPLTVEVFGARLHVQPPVSQGILLAMAAQALAHAAPAAEALDHAAIELTQAAFAHRDEVGRGAALLDLDLNFDPARAAGRGGPRAYLHTAGVSAADASGQVATSLVSVFDDFGSGLFVPEGGFVLNNRLGGFTGGGNAFAPGRRPVHTLAPALVEAGDTVLALSTPGADGQVQTLLQVLLRWLVLGTDPAEAIAAPRWRSEDGKLLIEADHPGRAALEAKGHCVVELPAGDMRFGAVTAAGHHRGAPFAIADWRRQTWAGVA